MDGNRGRKRENSERTQNTKLKGQENMMKEQMLQYCKDKQLSK